MSYESESYKHEQHTPDYLLHIYTKRLKLIQNRIKTSEDPAEYQDDIQECASKIAELLDDNNTVLISGNELLIPEPNLITGRLAAVQKSDCLEKQLIDIVPLQTSDKKSDIGIFYRLRSEDIVIDDPYQHTESTIFMLAPVSSSEIRLPFNFEDAFIPEDDDEIAEIIDDCLLDSPIDLASLSSLVSEEFSFMNDLQQYKYLKYINSRFNFHDIEIRTDHFILFDKNTDSIPPIHVRTHDTHCSGSFQSFITFTTYSEEHPDQEKEALAILIENRHGNIIGVFTEDIESIIVS